MGRGGGGTKAVGAVRRRARRNVRAKTRTGLFVETCGTSASLFTGSRQKLARRSAVGLNDRAMSARLKRFFTPDEYFELEGKAQYKSRYVAGEIFAMAGVQPARDRLTINLLVALRLRFRGRSCDVFTSDIRVKAAAGDMHIPRRDGALWGAAV